MMIEIWTIAKKVSEDEGEHLIARVKAIGDSMLVDVKCGKAHSHLVIKFWRKTFLKWIRSD